MRGDVWLVDLNPTRGSEQSGIRPAIVMQRPNLDRFTSTTIIVPLTTNLRRLGVPGCVKIPAGEGGLTEASVVLGFQAKVIDRQRMIRKLGSLSAERLSEIGRALQYVLQLE
jgi:mRNA interferase MazF